VTDDELERLAAGVLDACRAKGLKIAVAESCTGGLIAGTLTAIAGSSDVVDRGFVTYSNEAKSEMLGVPPELIAEHGAVSRQVAEAMAAGVLAYSVADISAAVTGVAGPGGGTDQKPVGLVHIAAARNGGEKRHEEHVFGGDRGAVRAAAVNSSLLLLSSILD
jgi:nicotinamide-nucleotide amidase